MKRMFILLVFVFVSFLAGNESAFPANNKRSESIESVLKVKIFDYEGYIEEDKTVEKEINIFLSENHKIEQIFQTSAGAGTNGYSYFHTVITIFYRQ